MSYDRTIYQMQYKLEHLSDIMDLPEEQLDPWEMAAIAMWFRDTQDHYRHRRGLTPELRRNYITALWIIRKKYPKTYKRFITKQI